MKRYLFDLCVSRITGKEIPTPASTIDYSSLFALAVRQQIYPIAYAGVIETGDCKDTTLIDQVKAMVMRAGLHDGLTQSAMKAVLDGLDHSGVETILLKGFVLRDLYVNPCYRTMGDIDILLTPDGVETACKVLTGLGYNMTVTHEGREYRFTKPNVADIEAFVDLSLDFYAHYDASEPYRKNLLPYGGYKNIFTLSKEWQIAYGVMHFAKHLMQKGAGVRFVFDLYYMQSKYDYDDKEVRELIANLGLTTLYDQLSALIKKYFCDEDVDSALAERLLDYMLSYGVYGDSDEDADTRSGVRQKGKMRTFLSLVFPGYGVMKGKYPVLNKCPVLLPVYWVVRWVRGVKGGRVSVHAQGLRADQSEQKKLLDELNLGSIYKKDYGVKKF